MHLLRLPRYRQGDVCILPWVKGWEWKSSLYAYVLWTAGPAYWMWSECDGCPLPFTGLPHTIYVRSELQVLTRLQISGGVLFTIRTYRMRLDDIACHRRAALLAAFEFESTTTPLSRKQKEKFGDRVRSRFGRWPGRKYVMMQPASTWPV
jgi:hypothetical protein